MKGISVQCIGSAAALRADVPGNIPVPGDLHAVAELHGTGEGLVNRNLIIFSHREMPWANQFLYRYRRGLRLCGFGGSLHINVDAALCLLPHDDDFIGTIHGSLHGKFRHGSVSLIERGAVRGRDLHLQRPLLRLELDFERVALLQLQRVGVCAVHGFDVQVVGIRILCAAAVKGGVGRASGQDQQESADGQDDGE